MSSTKRPTVTRRTALTAIVPLSYALAQVSCTDDTHAALSSPSPPSAEEQVAMGVWQLIGEHARETHRSPPPALFLDPVLAKPEPFLESTGPHSPRIHMSRDIVTCMRLIAEANIYINYRAPSGLDVKTALGDYASALAQRLSAAVDEGHALHPVDVAEFFRVSPDTVAPLRTDPALAQMTESGFELVMLSLLSHEYGHFALGHLTQNNKRTADTALSDEVQADAYGRKFVREISPLVGLSIPTAFYLAYLYYDPGVLKGRVPDLCRRLVDNAVTDAKELLEEIHRNPTLAQALQDRIPQLQDSIAQAPKWYASCDQQPSPGR